MPWILPFCPRHRNHNLCFDFQTSQLQGKSNPTATLGRRRQGGGELNLTTLAPTSGLLFAWHCFEKLLLIARNVVSSSQSLGLFCQVSSAWIMSLSVNTLVGHIVTGLCCTGFVEVCRANTVDHSKHMFDSVCWLPRVFGRQSLGDLLLQHCTPH